MSHANRSESPSLSIIIPVYAGGMHSGAAVGAAAMARGDGDELIVVVDGSAPESFMDSLAAADHLVVLNDAIGPAAARNAGAKLASSPVLFFLDSDVVVSSSAVEAIRSAFADLTLDAVIGSYDRSPPAATVPSRYKNLLNHFVHQNAGGPAETFWGACGAIRAEVFDAVGGFDPWYRTPSIEDIELGYRLVAAGYRIELRPEIQVTHLKEWSLKNLLLTDFAKRALPWSELLLVRGAWQNSLNVDRRSRVKVGLTGIAVASALAGRYRPVPGVLVTGGAVGATAWLDRRLLRFFSANGGSGFAAAAYVLHLVSYVLSGVAVVIAVARQRIGQSDLPDSWKSGFSEPSKTTKSL